MRDLARASAAAFAAVVVGCAGGGGPAPGACGAAGSACCAQSVCDAGLACVGGICQASGGSCGGVAQACCAGGTCGSGLACVQGTCQVPPPPCGGANQDCCAGGACDAGLACSRAFICGPPAPTCDAPFAVSGDVALPFAPDTLAAADLDSDGNLDLVAAGRAANAVAILMGKGDGTFAAPVTHAASGPSRVAIADLDGDGHLDVATAGGGTVTILYGPGFTSKRSITAGTALFGIAAADLDGDGKIDLVVTDPASTTSSWVVVLLNQGNGTFTQQRYAAGDYPYGVAVADLNHDGIPDVVAADYYISSTSGGGWTFTAAVLLGTGGGALAPAVLYPVGANAVAVAVGDLDADGNPDLAVADYADSNPAGVTILHGNGDGTFAYSGWYPTQRGTDDLRIADVNGDGHLDVLTANWASASVSVLLGDGTGAFTVTPYAVGGNPTAALPGDLDRDGKLDLAVASFQDRAVRILRGGGDGTFAAPRVTQVGREPVAIAAGDLDRDGRLDLVVAERTGGSVGVLLGNGDGTFRRSAVATGGWPVFVALADVNADGLLDVVWSDSLANAVGVLLGNGDGTFTAKPSLPMPSGDSSPLGIAVGDLNGDGNSDLVVATHGGAAVFLGNGDGTFAAGAPIALPAVMSTAASHVALVDLDGDGKLDLVAGGYDLYVAKGNGDGTFQAPAGRGAYDVADLVVADVNGDGAPDLAAAFPTVYSGPSAKVYPNQGGALGTSTATPGPADPTAIAAGDLDGDGKVDLAVTGATSLLEVFLGKGDLTFPRTETLTVGDGAQDVVFGDFDGDGRLDAAVLSRYDDSVRVLHNVCP